MLLQKALAKLHNSYFALAQVDPRNLLEEVTGFPTTEINLNLIPDHQLAHFLSELTASNYLCMLRGRVDSALCEEKGKQECFTILNFYTLKEE